MARSLRQVRVGNTWLQVDDNNPVDPDFDGKNVSSDLTDLAFGSPFNVVGGVGASGIMYIFSNLAAADADQWRFIAYNTGGFKLESKASGSYVTIFSVDASGNFLTPKGNYIDRGDPSAHDWTEATLTADDAWHDLDLSSIVPAGAKAVALRVDLDGTVKGSKIEFRKNGNSNTINHSGLTIPIANSELHEDVLVACDANRVIEYWISSSGITSIDVVVKGWFI